MIRLRDINKSYRVGARPLPVLRDLSLEINEGEMVSIMGSSGSGKSTLLNILGILDEYDSGTYHLQDTLVKDLSERKAAYYRNRFIGFVFQSFNLLPFKNALENVAVPLYYQKIPRRKRHKIASEYLEKVDLLNWADHLPSELSGGQKQRIALARALITEPKIILADEPTGALDTKTSLEIMKLLREVNESGKTVVVVTHEHDIADMTDRTIRLRDGQIERDGKPRSAEEPTGAGDSGDDENDNEVAQSASG